MSEKQKPRKSHPEHNSEPNWRTRQQCNNSKLKYLRDTVLEKFQPSESLPIPVPEDILSVFLPVSSLPSCSLGKFMHGLGDSVNSRKFFSKEKTHEKGHAEAKKKEENEGKNDNKDGKIERELIVDKAKKAEKREKVEKKEKIEKDQKIERVEKKEVVEIKGKNEKEESKEYSEIWDTVEAEEEVKEQKQIKIISGSENTSQIKKNEMKEKGEAEELKEKAPEDSKKAEKLKVTEEKTVIKNDVEENPKLSNLTEKTAVNPNSKKAGKEKPKPPPKDQTESKKQTDQSKSPFGPSKQASEPSKSRLDSEKKLPEQSKNPKDKKPQAEPQIIPEPKSQKKSVYPDNSNMPNTQKLNLPETVQKAIPATAFPVPTLDKSQLASHSTSGNPFAKILLFTGKSGDDPSKFYFPADSKVYERLWFYKDPQSCTQGPFSCLEMYNWVSKGCFPDSLQIAFSNSEFLPMKNYSATKPEPPSEQGKKNPWSNSAKLFSKENNKKQ